MEGVYRFLVEFQIAFLVLEAVSAYSVKLDLSWIQQAYAQFKTIVLACKILIVLFAQVHCVLNVKMDTHLLMVVATVRFLTVKEVLEILFV